ncbi:MAG: hypothetical protein JW798_09155 [Prolixibacteraceae bacterium]|nr:hypothetical protein [Prolixibacteraceae bacterium]
MASNYYQGYKPIEGLIEKYAGIKEAVVVDKGSKYLKKRLVAYFTAQGHVDHHLLRQHVANEMNENDIPVLYIQKERLPFNEAGAPDFGKLSIEPIVTGKTADRGILSQFEFDPLYKKLKAIWVEELNLPRVQPWHCFFDDLGGDSVFAEFVVKRIEKELKIDLPYFILYRYRTLAGLTEYIHRGGDTMVSVDTLRLPADESVPVIVFVPPVKGGADTYNFALKTFPEPFGLYVLTYNIVDEKSSFFYPLDSLMEQAAVIIDQMNMDSISLLGYSMGGLLAFEIATCLNTTALSKVILLDIPPAKKKGRNLVGLIGQDLRLISKNIKRKDRKALSMNIRHIFWCMFYLIYRGKRAVWFEKKNNLTMSEAAHLRFYRQFNHKKLNGDMLLVRSTDENFSRYKYNWEQFVNGILTVETLNANHNQLLQPQVLKKLSELVIQATK